MRKFSSIYLLHGRGGSPDGTVLKLQEALQTIPLSEFKRGVFERPLLAHTASNVTAEESFSHAARQYGGMFRTEALVIGVSLGGLIAAAIQETTRPDLTVIAISSPTGADNLRLDKKMPKRVAIFNSKDPVIFPRTATWPLLAESHDVIWLTHDTDAHRFSLAWLINTYIQEGNLKEEAETLWAEPYGKR